MSLHWYGPSRTNCLLGLFFAIFLLYTCTEPGKETPWTIPHAQSIDLNPITSKGGLLILPVQQDGQDGLGGFQLKTGEMKWFYADRDSLLASVYYNMDTYLHGDKLLLPLDEKMMALQTSTGRVLWKTEERSPGQGSITGIGEWAFRGYSNFNQTYAFVQKINVNTGKSTEVFRIEQDNNEQLFLRSPLPYYDVETGDTLLFVSLIKYIPKEQTENELLVWSMKYKRFLKKLEAYPKNKFGYGITKQGIGNGEASFWVASRDLFRINMDEISEQWRTTLPADMLTSRPVLIDGRLYFPAENDTIYALDPENGRKTWSNKLAGTPGRLSVFKDHIFVVGGSDQKLHIFNKDTGKAIAIKDNSLKHLLESQDWLRTSIVKDGMIALTDGTLWYAWPINQLLYDDKE